MGKAAAGVTVGESVVGEVTVEQGSETGVDAESDVSDCDSDIGCTWRAEADEPSGAGASEVGVMEKKRWVEEEDIVGESG